MLMKTTVSPTMARRIDLLRLAGVAGRYVKRLLRLLILLPADAIAALAGLIKLHVARLFAQVHDRCVAGVLVVFEDLGSVHIR